jgi:ABC-type multidrug transport system fused ATPase/permease subunit
MRADGGGIVERGTHGELLRQNGLYAQLYHIQSAPFRETGEFEWTGTPGADNERAPEGSPMTVAQWIADGHQEVSHDELVAAAMAATADGFIQSLPAGYDTLLGTGGVQLDVEQRQQLSLARTIVTEIVERRQRQRS